MSRSLQRVVVVLPFLLSFCSAQLDFIDDKEFYRIEGNPGVKVRLTDKGLNYLRQVAINLLNDEIPNIAGLAAEGAFGEATVNLTQITVTRWRPADYTLLRPSPPNKLVLGLENADLGLTADFVGQQGPFTLPGKIEGEARGLTVAAEMSLSESGGGLRINPSSCKAVVATSTFEIIPDPTNLVSAIVRAHIPAANNALRAFLPTVICRAITGALNGIGNGLIGGEELKVPLAPSTVDVGVGQLNRFDLPGQSVSVADGVASHFLDNAVFDVRLMRDPISTYEYLETWHFGDAYYSDNIIRTPFRPRPMPNNVDTTRMIYVQISEFVFNSLLYHVYINNKLQIDLDSNAAGPLKNFLRTTCGTPGEKIELPDNLEDDFLNRICIGSLVPSLNAEYPNQKLDLEFYPIGFPEFELTNGQAILRMSGRLLGYIKGKQVLAINADLLSDAEIKLDEKRVSGDFRLNELDLYVHKSSLRQLNPKNVEQLSPVAKQLLGPELSKVLGDGFPLPLQDLVTLYNQEVELKDGYILISADLEMNEAKVQQQFKEQLNGALGGDLSGLTGTK